MLKSDKQMDRIKGKIVSEQVRIKKFEEKKQKLQSIKFNKAVKYYLIIFNSKIKDSRSKEKSEYKKKSREGIEKWKKRKSFYLIVLIFRY